jgi:hypothetical protein
MGRAKQLSFTDYMDAKIYFDMCFKEEMRSFTKPGFLNYQKYLMALIFCNCDPKLW